MTLFPELRYRGLLSDVPTLPGLLGQSQGPQAPPQAQGPSPVAPQAPPQPQGQGGGIGHALGAIFGGMDDPRLSPEQNAAAKHQALIQAGLAILASPDSGLRAIAQGGLYGQQAGHQNREVSYGRTQHDRYEKALQDPKMMEGLPDYIKAIMPYLPAEEGLKAMLEAHRNRFINTGFDGMILDANSGQWVPLPAGVGQKPEDWVKGDVTLNPATSKYENTFVLKSDPTKVRFLGEAVRDQKAPVFGSPEWEAAFRKQKAIEAEYAKGGGGVVPSGKQLAETLDRANKDLTPVDTELTGILPNMVRRSDEHHPGPLGGALADIGRAAMGTKARLAHDAALAFVEPASRFLLGSRMTDARMALIYRTFTPTGGEGDAEVQAKRDRRNALRDAVGNGQLKPLSDNATEADADAMVNNLLARFSNTATGADPFADVPDAGGR